VQERLSLEGIPVELVDTAGLREAANEAERIGIMRSREAFADAGLVLLVLDATQPLNAEELSLLEAAQGRPLFVACNKCDLLGADTASHSALEDVHRHAPAAKVLLTSARSGEGIDALRRAMAKALTGDGRIAPESAMLTSLRQHTAVYAARTSVERAQSGALDAVPHEMLLLDLYAALSALDSLTGTTTPDDILNLIFSTFCIGK
jgi:tRNA modification GTPase